MIYIKKGDEPEEFRQWKKDNPNARYKHDIPSDISLILRNALLEEQGFICCFCGCAIGPIENNVIIQRIVKKSEPHYIRNAHITPQSVDQSRDLDYYNICASCNTDKCRDSDHCDAKQKNRIISITPLQKDCLSYFSFNSDGTIQANKSRSLEDQKKANETIRILGLDENSLNLEREKCIQMVMELPENEIAEALSNLAHRNENNAFAPFYFVPLSYYGVPI